MKRKKRLKLEVVLDEALKILPRGMDIPCFTEWVKETVKQEKKLPRSHHEQTANTDFQSKAIQSKTPSNATSDQ